MAFINTLQKEIMNKANSQDIIIDENNPLKNAKLDEERRKARALVAANFYIGVKAVIQNMNNIANIICLKTYENDAICQPILRLSTMHRIRAVALHYETVYDKVQDITG